MKQTFRLKYLIIFLLIICIFSLLHSSEKQQVKNNNVWCNDELCITFNGGYACIIDLLTRLNSNNYFDQIEGIVKYCKEENQPESFQQATSEDGWLCSMYILPSLKTYNINDEIKKHIDPRYKLSKVEELNINNLKVYKWRYEHGKTRLDHFLVICNKHNYLFVSSVWGDNGEIKELINSITFIK